MSLDPPPTISRYRVVRRLDAGSAVEVYHAEDPQLGRPVALKVVPAASLTSEDAENLREEARALAAFSHPAIATLYELGESDGSLFLALEYVDGETLAERIRRGPLPFQEAVDIARRVAEALAAAHRRGWVHRDVTSTNVMLAEDDGGQRVKLLDFGLAGRFGTAGEAGGTPGYIAPEVIRGAVGDEGSDLFSLGVVLYEMLAGHRPFEGEDRAAVLRSTLEDPLPPLRREDVPLALEETLRRAVTKEPRGRHRSVDEFATELGRLERGEPVRRETASPRTPLAERLRRLRTPLLSVALLGGAFDTALFSWGLEPGWIGLGLVALAAPYLLDRLVRRRVPDARGEGVAFRGLAPFQEADRDAFFGRDVEVAALAERLAQADARFTVLFGESGSGKTSLLRAGLLPRLRERGALALYMRGYVDPVAAVVAETERQTAVEARSDEPAVEYLRRVRDEMDAEIVLVFDQLEEFFIHFRRSEEREPFLEFLAACHDAGDVAVKILLALRSDFLYLVNAELDGRIPEPLASTKLHALKRLGRRQAEEVLRRSAARAGLPLEDALLRHLVHDLDTEGGDVLPTELQIVGDQIQTKRILTVAEYRRAGGKEALVHAFLEDVIRTSPDPDGSRLLLTSLISDENTRLALPLAEIAHRAQRSRGKLAALLEHFVRARLVREIQEQEPWRYELQHEYLIDRIHEVSGRVMDARQRANRLFRQHLASHAVDGKARIPIGQLWFLHRYSDVERSTRARRLLASSLRWGLAKLTAGGVLLVLVAAAFSVREEWEGVRLRDGHTAAVRRVVFSPDGERVYTASEDGTVMVWDFASRQRLQSLTEHEAWVVALAISPDGELLASGDLIGRVMIWDTMSLNRIKTLEPHFGPVRALAFSPDGRWLVSPCAPSKTVLWSTTTWLPERMVSQGVSEQGSVSFSSDSSKIFMQTDLVWDLETNEAQPDKGSTLHWSNILGRSPDGLQIISMHGSGVVDFWRLPSSGDPSQAALLAEHRAHGDHGRVAKFSPGGRWAATGAEDIVLWDAATREILARMEHDAIVWDLAFSPDGLYIVSVHGDGAVLVWDVAERQRVADLREHSAPVRSVDFSPSGLQLASASEDRMVRVWDLETRCILETLRGHAARVNSIDYAAKNRLISLDQDGRLILWDLENREAVWQWFGRDGAYVAAVSPDGKWVVTSQGVHDMESGQEHMDFRNLPVQITQEGLYGLAFSPDGRRVAMAEAGGAISLLAVDPWQLLEWLKYAEGHLVTISFSPDGKLLVTGNDNGDVQLWSIPLSPGPLLGRHTARVKAVAFSPDGRRVASVGDDQTVRIWDVRRRRLVGLVGTHSAPTLSVAFSPNGRQIAVGGHDHSVRVYTRRRTLWGYEVR